MAYEIRLSLVVSEMCIRDRMYTSEHECVKIENNIATVGITDFAQGELGDIIFLEFPDVDESFNEGDVFGTIEAVKTVSDLFMPVSGKIVEVNEALNDDPENVNSSPYDSGWMVKIELSADSGTDSLLDSKSYIEMIG